MSRKMRSTTVSRGDAQAAQDLHERSTTRPIASEQITLHIELSFERALALVEHPGGVPDRQPARWRSITLSASMKPTPSCSPSGLPNASRVRA